MAIPIKVPRLGWSMEEGTFGEWLIEGGKFVDSGVMLFVLEGDKASQEIESFDSGILHIPPNAPRAGDTVMVGQTLGFLLSENESPPELSAGFDDSGSQTVTGGTTRDTTRGVQVGNGTETDSPDHPAGRPRFPASRRQLASPRARRAATRLGIELQELVGTGRAGRIREQDVLRQKKANAAVLMETVPVVPGHRAKTSRTRRLIAKNMMSSVQQTAAVTLTTKADATALVSYREALKSGHTGVPTYMDILMTLVARNLPDCPELNACWFDDSIFIYDEINIAFAVDTPSGLLAPVIAKVPEKSLTQISQEVLALIAQARDDAIASHQLVGGTFTISNLGMFGIDSFTPIINLPQSAVLGVGRICDEPVVRNETVQPGKTITFSLTFDHRVIDGAPAARWLQMFVNSVGQLSYN